MVKRASLMVRVARTICDCRRRRRRDKNITKFSCFFTCTATALPAVVLLVVYSSMTNAGAPFLRWRISRFVDAFIGDAASCRVDCHLSKFSLR